jgi:hypothetical protein
MGILSDLVLVVLAGAALYVLYYLLKNLAVIIANSIFGIIALFFLNSFFGLGIPINFWNVLAVAIGGVPGLVLVIIFHFLGLGF